MEIVGNNKGGAVGKKQRTNGCDVATTNLVVGELRDETSFPDTTVPTEEHLEQVVVVTVHVTHSQTCIYL